MNSHTAGKIKYANYSRKSSEDRDKQVLSLPAQIGWAKEIVKRIGTTLVETLTEEKSAKIPNNRPQFTALVNLIHKGEITGIICWKLDRLARNPEEAGIILGLLQRGQIRHIVTSDREYRPEDNALISYVDFGMADQYVRDLSKNVRRGLKAKVAAGWRPGVAPIGYLNNFDGPKGERTIVSDPERFELVRRVLEVFLNGEWSVRKLRKEAIGWGVTTRQTKRQGGKPPSLAHVYRMLTDPFYAGYFWTKSTDTGERELVKGAHGPMITMEQFDLIQAKLGRRGKPRPRSDRFFPFTGKAECGECASMITAEEKHQLICTKCKHKFAHHSKDACPKCNTKIESMEKPTILHYTYYHCTKRKNPKCTQKTIRVEDFEVLLDKALTKFQLSDDFTQWALEELANDNDREIKSQNQVIDSQQNEYKRVVDRLQNLVRLYTSPENAKGDLLSLEEYTPQRKALLAEKRALEEAQQTTGRRVEEWINWAENSFSFAVAARVWFENGSPEQKRDIFSSLSRSNLILKDKELRVSLKNPLDLYAAVATKYPSTTITLEPTNNGANQEKYLAFANDIPNLRAH